MKRRKFVIGLGSLTAGGAAATGTGAFSAMTADRDADIEVVNDASALVALDPQLPSETVREENGELYIDTDPNNEDTGLNPNSEYHFGNSPIPYDSGNGESAAFHVVNNDTVEHEVTVTWTQDELPDTEWPTYFRFYVGNEDDDGDRANDINGNEAFAFVDPARGNSSTGSVTQVVAPGEYAAVAFSIVTGHLEEGAEPPLEFSGTFTVDAE